MIMTANLFGDIETAKHVAPKPARTGRAPCVIGAYESFRRVDRETEEAGGLPNSRGQYPYQVYHASLADMRKGQRDMLIEILAIWSAKDILEITNALDRWKRLSPWERQNFLQGMGLNTL